MEPVAVTVVVSPPPQIYITKTPKKHTKPSKSRQRNDTTTTITTTQYIAAIQLSLASIQIKTCTDATQPTIVN